MLESKSTSNNGRSAGGIVRFAIVLLRLSLPSPFLLFFLSSLLLRLFLRELERNSEGKRMGEERIVRPEREDVELKRGDLLFDVLPAVTWMMLKFSRFL